MWAPSVVEKQGKYYFFFGANDIQNDQQRGGIGVAVADQPEGPYRDLLQKPLLDHFEHGAQPIDQFAFHDPSGQYFLIYGGWRHCNIARLKPDFTGFEAGSDGEIFKEITPEGYVEGPYMLVRNGKYYLMWSEGGWTGPDYSVAYAIADSPLGPFKRIGKFLQQDPQVATGAGHHSVFKVPGRDQYYIVYHRRPLGDHEGNHRVVCIDRMEFDEQGLIKPVKITFEGVTAQPIEAPMAGLSGVASSTTSNLPSCSFNWNVQQQGTMNYLQYLPKDYAAQPDKRWPLMLFLQHGSGERGSNVQSVAKHGPFKLVREGREFPFIIIAPQCPTGEHWQVEPLMQLVAEAEKKFHVDSSRIYVTGLSMGGFGTWDLGVSHPEKFAAIIPICGGGNGEDIVMSSIDHSEALKSLPVWAFHGGKDPVVPVAASQETVALMKDKGVREIKLTIYPEAVHDSWTQTYENPEIYDWLLQHHR